jgi:hypothetical protein
MSFAKFAQEKDAASFRTTFQDAIQSAIADELEQEKLAVAQSMFGSDHQLEEDYEQMNEGSGDRLAAAIDAAPTEEHAKKIIGRMSLKNLHSFDYYNGGLDGARKHPHMKHVKAEIARRYDNMNEDYEQMNEGGKENRQKARKAQYDLGLKGGMPGREKDVTGRKYIGRGMQKNEPTKPRGSFKALSNEEVEQIDELNRELGSILNRYIRRATDDFGPRKGREAGVALALKKKWGNKKYGLDEPKVKAVHRP